MALDVQPSPGQQVSETSLCSSSVHVLSRTCHELIELHQWLSLPCRLQVQWIGYSVLQDKLALSRLSGLSPDFWSQE